MKAQRLMVAALVVPLLVAGLATLAGPASAQGKTNTVQITCPGGPPQIQPLGAPGSWSCTAVMTFGGGGVSDPVNFVTLVLNAPDAPSWANVVLSPSSVSFLYAPGDGPKTQPFTVLVALTQDAPAFQTQRITITGQLSNPNAAEQNDILPTQIAVTPGYFNLYNVRVDQKIGRGGPQDAVTYPIVIDNFSNGDTRFEFALATEEAPEGFQPVVPEPFVLQSRATGGKTTSGQVSFQVYTPFRNGYVNDIGALQLRVDSFYAPNTNIKGASSQVSTLTQARGFYVPGPGAPLVVLGIAGTALALAAVARQDE